MQMTWQIFVVTQATGVTTVAGLMLSGTKAALLAWGVGVAVLALVMVLT